MKQSDLFLAVVTNRFFVVYEDPSRSQSKELKQLLPKKKTCIAFYGICSEENGVHGICNEENGDHECTPNIDNVIRYNMCYG